MKMNEKLRIELKKMHFAGIAREHTRWRHWLHSYIVNLVIDNTS